MNQDLFTRTREINYKKTILILSLISVLCIFISLLDRILCIETYIQNGYYYWRIVPFFYPEWLLSESVHIILRHFVPIVVFFLYVFVFYRYFYIVLRRLGIFVSIAVYRHFNKI